VDPDTVYIVTDTGVFRSTTGGDSWQSLGAGLPPKHYVVLAVDPSRPQSMYAGTDSGVFESTDRGESWLRLGSGLRGHSVSALALDPSGHKIYAGTCGGGVVDLSLDAPTAD
jgi:photosystem II stability/assembly factor-like uncharacterized protein